MLKDYLRRSRAPRYSLLFAYRRKPGRRGVSDDGVISLASQLRPEAQDEASLVHGFDETLAGVLGSPDTAALLNVLLR